MILHNENILYSISALNSTHLTFNPTPLHLITAYVITKTLNPASVSTSTRWLWGSKSGTVLHPAVPIRPLLWSSRPSRLAHILSLLSLKYTIHLVLYHTLFNYPPLVLIKRPSLLAPLPLRHTLYLVWPPSLRPSLCLCTFLSSSLIPPVPLI